MRTTITTTMTVTCTKKSVTRVEGGKSLNVECKKTRFSNNTVLMEYETSMYSVDSPGALSGTAIGPFKSREHYWNHKVHHLSFNPSNRVDTQCHIPRHATQNKKGT
jgi:hypothetical protein